MIEIKQKISLERVGDLLCSAWEGGSAYWCVVEKITEPKVVRFGTMENSKPYSHEIALNKGGSVQLRDTEEGKIIPKLLTLATIKKGLQVMADNYPKHWADFVRENDDATTGDVFLQCCIFGEIIYG